LPTGKYDFKVRTVQLLGVEDAEVELSDLTVEMEELIVELEALPAALLAEMRLTVVFWAVKFLAVVGLSAEKDVVVAMEQFSLSHGPEDIIKDLLAIYVISVPQTKVIQRGKGFLLQVQTQILIPYLIHFLK